jgi:hypothetical protein
VAAVSGTRNSGSSGIEVECAAGAKTGEQLYGGQGWRWSPVNRQQGSNVILVQLRQLSSTDSKKCCCNQAVQTIGPRNLSLRVRFSGLYVP